MSPSHGFPLSPRRGVGWRRGQEPRFPFRASVDEPHSVIRNPSDSVLSFPRVVGTSGGRPRDGVGAGHSGPVGTKTVRPAGKLRSAGQPPSWSWGCFAPTGLVRRTRGYLPAPAWPQDYDSNFKPNPSLHPVRPLTLPPDTRYLT